MNRDESFICKGFSLAFFLFFTFQKFCIVLIQKLGKSTYEVGNSKQLICILTRFICESICFLIFRHFLFHHHFL